MSDGPNNVSPEGTRWASRADATRAAVNAAIYAIANSAAQAAFASVKAGAVGSAVLDAALAATQRIADNTIKNAPGSVAKPAIRHVIGSAVGAAAKAAADSAAGGSSLPATRIATEKAAHHSVEPAMARVYDILDSPSIFDLTSTDGMTPVTSGHTDRQVQVPIKEDLAVGGAKVSINSDSVSHVSTKRDVKRGALPANEQIEAKAASAAVVSKRKKAAGSKWFVSYAWGDDRSSEGMAREQRVDELWAEAKARGKPIHRDKEALRPGDSIENFMRRIGAGARVFVFLSDKYLKSPFCMFELCEVWSKSRKDAGVLRNRLRLWALDDADIKTEEGRAAYARHWRERHEQLRPHVADLGGRDLLAWQRMRTFHHEVGDILATIADTVQPRRFDDFLRWGFDDPEP